MWKYWLDVAKVFKDVFGHVAVYLRGLLGRRDALEEYHRSLQKRLDDAEPPVLGMEQPKRSAIYVDLDLVEVDVNGVRGANLVTLETLVGRSDNLRVLIEGEAGDGKSTVLKEFLARRMAGAGGDGSRRAFPAFIGLRELPPEEDPIFRKIARQLHDNAKQSIISEEAAREHVREARNKGELVVALDGLDECADYDRAVSEVRKFCEWCDVHEGNTVAVTCRKSRRPAGLSGALPLRLAVEPLRDEQIYEFLDKWPRRRDKLVGDLKSKLAAAPSDVRAFCSNPLVLTLLVHLYLNDAAAKGPFEVPPNRAKLYDRILDELLLERRGNKGQPPQFPAAGKRIVLGCLAYERFLAATDRRKRADPERIEPGDLALAIQQVMRGPDGPTMGGSFSDLFEPDGGGGKLHLTTKGETFLDELRVRDGVLKADPGAGKLGDGRPRAYSPFHRSVLEFLAADHAAKRLATIKPQVLRDRFWPTQPDLLAYYAALVPSAKAILVLTDKHHEGDTDYHLKRARLLAIAEAVSDELPEAERDAVTRRIKETVEGIVGVMSEESVPVLKAEKLEALAAIAAKKYQVFENARDQLMSYVKYIIHSRIDHAEFNRIIETYPDPLLDILYDLRDDIRYDWREILVWRLAERFHSTDDPLALQRLAGFLKDPGVKREAAYTLIGLVYTTPEEVKGLRDNEVFRDISDGDARAVWPLDRLFPGKVAYRLVEASGGGDRLVLDVFRQAHRALTGVHLPEEDREWRRVDIDLRRNARITATAFVCMIVFTLLSFLFDSMFLIYAARGAITGEALQFTWDRGFYTIPSEATRGFKDIRAVARQLLEQIESIYPDMQTLPVNERQGYMNLCYIEWLPDPEWRLTPMARSSVERLGGNNDTISRLEDVQINFNQKWFENMDRGWRVPGVSAFRSHWYNVIFGTLVGTVFHFLSWRIFSCCAIESMAIQLYEYNYQNNRITSILHSLCVFISGAIASWIARYLAWGDCLGDRVTWLIPFFLCIASLLLVLLISHLCFHRNRFIKSVREFENILKTANPGNEADQGVDSPSVWERVCPGTLVVQRLRECLNEYVRER